MSKQKVLVIGGGFGGLAAAIRLQARGHEVTILEKRDKLGGRGYVYELDGFRFDGGPTIITAPYMFDDLWALAGRKRADDVTFVPCDPFYRIFSHEGLTFDASADADAVSAQIERISPADVDGYRRYLRAIRPIFETGFVGLADQPFLAAGDMARAAPDLLRLASYINVYPYVSRFFRHEFLRQCFSFHPLLIGGNPFAASSIYAMIHELEREWGVWYAMGGTGALVAAMGRLFAGLGGQLRLNAEVTEILAASRGRKVLGARLADGTVHRADAVVANSDVARTYMDMIPAHYRPANSNRRYGRYSYSMSLFVTYFGTDRQYRDQNLLHHNIILGPRYRELLADVFQRKVLAEDFSLYLHMPTLTDPGIAPPGHEGFYVLSPVPHLGGVTDWAAAAEPYQQAIFEFLEANYLPVLREHLVVQHHIDPTHFRDVLNSHLGSAFSVEPTLLQSAWFRPHNRSEDFDNLYLVGAGTHPGAGLPGVLSSAIIADRLIHEAAG